MSGSGSGQNMPAGQNMPVSPVPFPGFSPRPRHPHSLSNAPSAQLLSRPGHQGDQPHMLSQPQQPSAPRVGQSPMHRVGHSPQQSSVQRVGPSPLGISQNVQQRAPPMALKNAAPRPASAGGQGMLNSAKKRARPNLPFPGGGPENYVMTAEAMPAPRYKRRKVASRNIPADVVKMVPEALVYQRLQAQEEVVDKVMMRKKMEYEEALKAPPLVRGKLMVHIFNTHNDREKGSHQSEASHGGAWTLHVVATLMDPEQETSPGGATGDPVASNFLKKVTVQLDHPAHPSNYPLRWEDPEGADNIQIRHDTSGECTATVTVELNHVPKELMFSPLLTDLLGVEHALSTEVCSMLWQYIKFHRCQDAEDPAVVNCNDGLRALFGEERIKMASILGRLSAGHHLHPIPPLTFRHRIQLSGDVGEQGRYYEVDVDVPSPSCRHMSNFLEGIKYHADIDNLDAQIAGKMKEIEECKKRRVFFRAYSENPGEFSVAVIKSQEKDLKHIVGGARMQQEVERRAAFYQQSWSEEAAVRCLHRRLAAGLD